MLSPPVPSAGKCPIVPKANTQGRLFTWLKGSPNRRRRSLDTEGRELREGPWPRWPARSTESDRKTKAERDGEKEEENFCLRVQLGREGKKLCIKSVTDGIHRSKAERCGRSSLSSTDVSAGFCLYPWFSLGTFFLRYSPCSAAFCLWPGKGSDLSDFEAFEPSHSFRQ